jgi:hypothetical protein
MSRYVSTMATPMKRKRVGVRKARSFPVARRWPLFALMLFSSRSCAGLNLWVTTISQRQEQRRSLI